MTMKTEICRVRTVKVSVMASQKIATRNKRADNSVKSFNFEAV